MFLIRPVFGFTLCVLWLMPSKAFSASLLLAQGEGASSKYAACWAVIIFTVVLGLIVTLKSSNRKMEFKRHGVKRDKD